ncbi:MAG: response regulator [Pirellulales bacterium]|nr:response regulator [Pirellulales bacterium]
MTKNRSIQLTILLPLGLVLIVLLAAYSTMALMQEDTFFDQECEQSLDTAYKYYKQRLANMAQSLGGIAAATMQDRQLLNIWQSQNRQQLLDYCRPLAEKLQARNRITHIYFIDPDRRCFLRLYKPDTYGEVIDRFTLREAQRTKKNSWGIELGRFGTFTLRYVYPVIRDKKLLGFFELGTEVDPILREVQKTTNVNFVLLVKKQWLGRNDWESGMALLGRQGNWDQLSHAVVTESTFNKVPPEIIQKIQDDPQSLKHNETEVVFGGHTYRVGQMPLKDAAKRSIGEILMFFDVDAHQAWREHSSNLLLGFGITSSLVFLLITAMVIRRVKKRLEESDRRIAKEQEALRESEARFCYIASLAQDAILVVDHRGRITFWSAAATEIFGYSAEETLGREVHALLAPPESSYQLRRLFPRFRDLDEKTQANRTEELEARRKNGEIRSFEVSLSSVDWRNQWQTIAVFRDVTSRKRNETMLRQAIGQAEAANNAKSHFLANMSHEIRTPLNVILGFTELLDDGCKQITETERHEFLQTIYASGQQLMILIDDILDLSKIETEGVEIERQRCQPMQVLGHVLSLLRVRALEKHITLDSEWPQGAPESIETDPDRLRQLLMHLVGNAIKFTDMGGVRIVSQMVDEGGKQLLAFDIIDSGIGIPADQLETIFDPFIQVDRSDTHRRGGTGLGLPIARRIALALGGQLTVTSQPGKGSTFRAMIDPGSLEGVRILDVHSTDFIVTPDPVIPHCSLRIDNARILLMEDGDTNRKMLTRVLERAGAKVTTAEDGHTGVELALRKPFDVILMDMQMPLMDGYTAAALLRAQGATLPIVALTAHALKGDKEKCLQAGCSDYLSKPVNVEKLLHAVVEALNRDKPSRPSRQETSPPPEADLLTSTLSLDDPELCEVVTDFVGQLEGRWDAMHAAWQEGQWEKLAELAHWLKGAGGTMGFPAFTEPASRLQQQARERENEGIDRLLDELRAIIHRIVSPSTSQPTAP